MLSKTLLAVIVAGVVSTPALAHNQHGHHQKHKKVHKHQVFHQHQHQKQHRRVTKIVAASPQLQLVFDLPLRANLKHHHRKQCRH